MWSIAFETGWTLEYIEGLSVDKFHEYVQVKDGKAKAGVR